MWLVQEKRLELVLHLAGGLAAGGLALLAGVSAGMTVPYAILWMGVAYLSGVLRAGASGRRDARAVLAVLVQVPVAVLLLGASFPAVLGFTAAYLALVPASAYALARSRLQIVILGQGELARRVEGALHAHGLAVAGQALRAGRVTTVVAAPLGAVGVFRGGPGSRARRLDAVSFLEKVEGKVPVEILPDDWHLDPDGFRLTRDPVVAMAKRGADIVLSLLGLAVGLPLLLLCGLLVRLSSPGPVLFRQERTGLGGRAFTIRKLRTMVVHDPRRHSPYAAERDPRLTAVGVFLRRTHLDELPQLANVLVGDMSLVGPRAEWTVLAREYAHRLPRYALRHLIRPGLSGWAQVNFPYGRSVEDAREKLRYDLFYLKHYTLFLDVVVIARTIRMILGLR